MQKNKVLKGLLAVSTVAAMFASYGVQAQTQSAAQMQNQAAQTGTNMTGKSAADGAVNNTNSQGMEDRSGQVGSSTAGQTGSSSSSSHSGHGMSGSTGASSAGMTTQSSSMQSGASGAAGATASSKLAKADTKAITDMAMANMAEVEAGKLAQSKSQNAEVKTFAQQMIDDHGKALQEVQTLAQSKGVTLPTELDAKHKAMATKLEKMTGDAFDREYMKTGGVKAHKDTLAMLKKHEKAAKDADVKALAGKMIPTVEQHLKAAEQNAMAKSGTTSGK